VSGVGHQLDQGDLSAALRESEERLRLIQAAAEIGSFDWDMVTGRVHRSPEYLAIQGLLPDAPLDNDYQDSWLDRVHPEDREQVLAWMREDTAKPGEFAREYRIIRPDTGETRWLYNRGCVAGDESGRPVRMISAQTDITGRKLGELRSRYMAALSDALHQAKTAREAMRAACEHLGRFLEVGQVGFGEVDESETWAEIHADWSAGAMPSRAGRYRLADFGAAITLWFKSGQPIVTEDVELLASLPGLKEAADRFGARSGIDLPLLRDGKLVAILGIHHDRPRRWNEHELTIARITAERTRDAVERARAEEALRESEERMRLAIAGTGLAYFDLDMATGEGIWSETAFQMLGLEPPPDLRTQHNHWVERLHPADRERLVDERNAAEARGGPWSLEHRIIRADDGRVRWLVTHGQFIGPPDARRSVGVALDITERKQEELRQAFLLQVADRLRGSSDLREAINGVAELLAGALDVDTIGFVQIDVASGTGAILAGFTKRDEARGVRSIRVGPDQGPFRGAAAMPLLKGERFVVDDVATDPRTRDTAGQVGEASGAVAAVHVPVMRGDRLVAVLFVHSERPRAWEEEEIRLVEEVAARSWEAVERLRAELALRDANDRLASEVERAVAERESALAQLHQAQKLETIGQLTGGIAHDFNNLLTPITGALDLLRHRFESDERLARLIGGALQSAERARVLVQRLLQFARRQPLQPVAVDVARLLDGMRDLIASSVGRGIETQIEATPDLAPALADPNQLELAILNLCVNARDAMPEGGTLAVRADMHESFVRIAVEDSGTGMDAETLARAVEPFFSTKAKERGTGLGLSMVHGLAGQLGGSLAIDSAPGEGTRVHLLLPVASGAPEPERARPAGAGTSRPLSILLVDDEDLVRANTAELLRDLGHQVVACASGAAALERTDRFDLVVTDYMMPGMDGIEFAARIAEQRPGLPVLLITGFMGTADKAEHLPRLVKPFGRDELAAALAGLVSPHH
jgi:signal transduction histidine kinase/PAS domain-containing protein